MRVSPPCIFSSAFGRSRAVCIDRNARRARVTAARYSGTWFRSERMARKSPEFGESRFLLDAIRERHGFRTRVKAAAALEPRLHRSLDVNRHAKLTRLVG